MGSFGLGGGAIGFASAGSAGSPSTLTSPVTTDPLTFSGALTFSKKATLAAASGNLMDFGSAGAAGHISNGGAGLFIGGVYSGSGSDSITADNAFKSAAAGDKVVVVKGAASQSANLQDWQNSAGTPLTYINSGGSLIAAANASYIAHIGTGQEIILGYKDGSNVAAGFALGSSYDTNLYRSAADTLKTDDALVAVTRIETDGELKSNAGVVAAQNAGASRTLVGYIAGVGVGAGITFGSGLDTSLYRSATATVKTDNSLHVGTDFRHLGANLGFYNHATATQQTITGSRATGAALTDLLTKLALTGLIVDGSSA